MPEFSLDELKAEKARRLAGGRPEFYTTAGPHVRTRGINPQIMQNLNELAQDYYQRTGEPLVITSGFRTPAYQAKLYAEEQRKNPGSRMVARPGRSQHGFGNAVDIDKRQAMWLAANNLLAEHGFYQPHMGQGASGIVEPWHIQQADYERRAGKVAATVPQFTLEELKAERDRRRAAKSPAPAATAQLNDFSTPTEQRQAATPGDPPWYMKALSGAGKAISAPHEYVSKPIAKVVEPMLPNVPYKSPGLPKPPIPGMPGTPLDVDPKKVISLAEILDFPVYGTAGKLLGKAAGLFKGPKAVTAPSPTEMGAKAEAAATNPNVAEATEGLEEMFKDMPGAAASASAGAAEAAEAVGGAVEAPLATPSFLQPQTTPWVAGMTHPRAKGMTEGGFERRLPPGPRQNIPPATPIPSRLQPPATVSQYEFESARMGGQGFAPPAAAQFERTVRMKKAQRIVHQLNEKLGVGRGKFDPDAQRTLRLIDNLGNLGGMGATEELPWTERLTDLTRKNF